MDSHLSFFFCGGLLGGECFHAGSFVPIDFFFSSEKKEEEEKRGQKEDGLPNFSTAHDRETTPCLCVCLAYVGGSGMAERRAEDGKNRYLVLETFFIF